CLSRKICQRIFGCRGRTSRNRAHSDGRLRIIFYRCGTAWNSRTDFVYCPSPCGEVARKRHRRGSVSFFLIALTPLVSSVWFPQQKATNANKVYSLHQEAIR